MDSAPAAGATGSDVVSLFTRRGLEPTVAGLAMGLTLCAVLGQAIGSLPIGIAPADPLVLASVTAAVGVNVLSMVGEVATDADVTTRDGST